MIHMIKQSGEAKNSWTGSQTSCAHIKSLSTKVEEIEFEFQLGEKADVSRLLWISGRSVFWVCVWIPFQMILYEKTMRLPLSLPVGPRIPASDLQPPIWNVFAEAPSAVLENLKGRGLIGFRRTTSSVSQITGAPSEFFWDYFYCLQLIRKYSILMRGWFNWEIILCI